MTEACAKSCVCRSCNWDLIKASMQDVMGRRVPQLPGSVSSVAHKHVGTSAAACSGD